MDNLKKILKKQTISLENLCLYFNTADHITIHRMIEELAEKFEIEFNVVGGQMTYHLRHVHIPNTNNICRIDISNMNRIRFAVLGDTQLNSKYTQLTALHQFYDIAANQYGIDTFYHTGDMDEGEQMRMGHQYECYNQGADDHLDEIIRVYPRIDGIKTYFITGNHDHSLMKRAGYDIGRHIAKEREDMIYLGPDYAIIEFGDSGCNMGLDHPGGGTAYAISYKMQKLVSAMMGGQKPNIYCAGHYHKANQYRLALSVNPHQSYWPPTHLTYRYHRKQNQSPRY